jgi:thiosulfate reductase cytochrome b subunit
MDPIVWLLTAADPVLIAPFRFFTNPMAGWWAGIAALAFWSVFLGEVTMAGVFRINRSAVVKNMDETAHYHEQSLKAKQAGDEKAYNGINRLANEALGKSFFLMIAMGMAALWPAFFAAAWLDMRFGDLVFSLPKWAGGLELNFLAPFILCYVGMRVGYARIKHLLIRGEKTPSRLEDPGDVDWSMPLRIR